MPLIMPLVYNRRRMVMRAIARNYRAKMAARSKMRSGYYRYNFKTKKGVWMQPKKSNRVAKVKARRQIGKPISSASSAKTVVVQNTDLSPVDTKTLYWLNLVQVAHGPDLNERERNIINVSGVRIDLTWKNVQGDVPKYVNVAVVKDKESATDAGDKVNFFKSYGNTRSRDADNSLSALEYHTTPINTDRYVVLRHKRFSLGTSNFGTTVSRYWTTSGKNWTSVNKMWIPLKRQFQFDGDTGSTGTDKVWLVYWVTAHDEPKISSPRIGVVDVASKVVCYFRDVN